MNYTNRNANAPTSTSQLVTAYCSATASALATALGLKKLLERAGYLQKPVFSIKNLIECCH